MDLWAWVWMAWYWGCLAQLCQSRTRASPSVQSWLTSLARQEDVCWDTFRERSSGRVGIVAEKRSNILLEVLRGTGIFFVEARGRLL